MKLSSQPSINLIATPTLGPSSSSGAWAQKNQPTDRADFGRETSEPSGPILLPTLWATGAGVLAAAGGAIGGGLCGGVLGAGLGGALFGSKALSVGVAVGGALGAIGLGAAYSSCAFHSQRGETGASERSESLGEALGRSVFAGAGLGVAGGLTGAIVGGLVGLVTSFVGFDSGTAVATGATIGASLGAVGGVATGFMMNGDYWQGVAR